MQAFSQRVTPRSGWPLLPRGGVPVTPGSFAGGGLTHLDRRQTSGKVNWARCCCVAANLDRDSRRERVTGAVVSMPSILTNGVSSGQRWSSRGPGAGWGCRSACRSDHRCDRGQGRRAYVLPVPANRQRWSVPAGRNRRRRCCRSPPRSPSRERRHHGGAVGAAHRSP